MNLLATLRKLGDRLGVIELSPTEQQASAPAKVQTRIVTLSELIMTIQVRDVRELAKLPEELSTPLEEIFKAAGISAPSGGWTIDRLVEFVNTEKIRGMDHGEAQRETLGKLAAEKVDSAEVIKDAISRDQALDAFEDSIAKK